MSKRSALIVILLVMSQSMIAQVNTELYWKLPLLPFKVVLDDDGFSIEGTATVCTPIGSFGVAASYRLSEYDRNKHGGGGSRVSDRVVYKERIKEVERIVYVEDKDFTLIIREGAIDHLYLIPNYEEIAVICDGETILNI